MAHTPQQQLADTDALHVAIQTLRDSTAHIFEAGTRAETETPAQAAIGALRLVAAMAVSPAFAAAIHAAGGVAVLDALLNAVGTRPGAIMALQDEVLRGVYQALAQLAQVCADVTAAHEQEAGVVGDSLCDSIMMGEAVEAYIVTLQKHSHMPKTASAGVRCAARAVSSFHVPVSCAGFGCLLLTTVFTALPPMQLGLMKALALVPTEDAVDTVVRLGGVECCVGIMRAHSGSLPILREALEVLLLFTTTQR